MPVALEEAVGRLRKRLEGGAGRLVIQAPPGFGKTAVLDGLAASFDGERRVVRVAFPDGDDAALAAFVDIATQLDLVAEVMPPREPARWTWAARLDVVREALAQAGGDLLLLVDEPRFEGGDAPLGELLFRRRAAELTDALLGVRGAAVVMAGARIPDGVGERAGLGLPIVWNPADDTVARLVGRAPSPVVRQVLSALAFAGVDVRNIPPHDLLLDRLVKHDLARLTLQSANMRRVLARLAAFRRPFPRALLSDTAFTALDARERGIVEQLLFTVGGVGGTAVLPSALAEVIRAGIERCDPAWLPDEPEGDAHRFAAQHHRHLFEAARLRDDVSMAVREELEEIHHLTEAGDAYALIDRSLQFVEQYDALGKRLSQRALRAPRAEEEQLRRDAVRAYERAVEHNDFDAYAHHYIAYNLDILGVEPKRVEREYSTALRHDRGHPWYHGRHVGFLVTTAWMSEAREAWNRALVDLGEVNGTIRRLDYRELHAQLARLLLSRSQIEFAREVLDDVPDEVRGEAWWRALDQLHVCLEEDGDERLVFPPTLPISDRWSGPHLLPRGREQREVIAWRPGRVLGRDEQVVMLDTQDGEGSPIGTLRLDAESLLDQWQVAPRLLPVGTFVELIEHADKTKEMQIWDAKSSSFDAIPGLPPLFPYPDRFIRRAFARA